MIKRFKSAALMVWLMTALMAGAVAPAAAQAGDWLVSRVSQPAFYATDSKTWRPLEAGMAIPAKSWVNTGRTGRVLLQRNGDTVVMRPGSMTGIAAANGASNKVSIEHRTGQIMLDINKGNKYRVKVRTHHLTAVVKGTQFSVTASRSGSSVAVSEGLVGVSDNATGQSADVGAGQSASSSGGGLSGGVAASSSGPSSSKSAARSDRGHGNRGDGRAAHPAPCRQRGRGADYLYLALAPLGLSRLHHGHDGICGRRLCPGDLGPATVWRRGSGRQPGAGRGLADAACRGGSHSGTLTPPPGCGTSGA
jgi:hypothetical protein